MAHRTFHPLDPPLHTTVKDDRGFIHHITGKLLCPAEYIWSLNSQDRTKEKIRDRDPDFLVTAYSWPAFLYTDYTFDSSNIEKGLFIQLCFSKPSNIYSHLHLLPKKSKAMVMVLASVIFIRRTL
ncbi:hypothetical protein DFJ58DRAFT_847298 [Suillus subalutaceus]|uniref:uncharacterized protein n=1 Tax=Suillus subalutaceus TaxID=48586 RepID=UPI001B87602A|nr:uncharacterized protein DFJ58DRAFT_847298 [Suillus subalutaceus]KAG1835884.1 hypothetical protein DFJ58DRAFT_847298 [Suillus subalutaceus]